MTNPHLHLTSMQYEIDFVKFWMVAAQTSVDFAKNTVRKVQNSVDFAKFTVSAVQNSVDFGIARVTVLPFLPRKLGIVQRPILTILGNFGSVPREISYHSFFRN